MIYFERIKTLTVENSLGECPLWNHYTRQFYWTDMPCNQLLRYTPDSDTLERINTPENLCSFGFIANSSWLICAFQSGIAKFNPDNQEIDWIYHLPNAKQLRLNDGRVDRQGRFWVGSLIDNDGNDSDDPTLQGKLYQLNHQGIISEHLHGIRIANCLCWSPDGNTLYFGDSPRHEIYEFDFASDNGTLGPKKLFTRTPEGIHPDGSAIDAEGYVWNAQWGNGKIVRYCPNGMIDTEIQLPVTQATCLTFGGKTLDWLFITTANFGLDQQALSGQPQAGNVFIYKVDTQGINEPFFIDRITQS